MITALLLAGSLTAGASAGAAATAAEVDDRWLPWLGCWRLVEDDVREPLTGDSLGLGQEPVPRSGLVCMSPSTGSSGVTVTTSDGDEVFYEEQLVANGERLPASKGTCTGWQETDWSADGKRLFTRSELTCEEGRKLAVSGLSLVIAPSTWVELQVVDGAGARAVVVRRYSPVRSASQDDLLSSRLSPEMVDDARWARYEAADVLEVDEIVEVIRRSEPEIVEAAVLEMRDQGFDLSAEALLQLEKAGARRGLIDLMVALSFPDDFLVERDPGPEVVAGAMAPVYSGRSLAYPYYLAPFGAYYWYAPYSPVSIVRPSPGSSAIDVGRVVKGQGYTRVTRQSSSPFSSGGSGGSGRSGGDGGWSSGGGSGGGSAQPGGYSGGGTRTAKPRNR